MPKATPPVPRRGKTPAQESLWGRREQPRPALPTPCGGSGPADARELPRAHPLPEPPLEQVSLGYMIVHLRRAHAGRRGAGRQDARWVGTVEASCLGNPLRRYPGACVAEVERGLQPKPRPIRGRLGPRSPAPTTQPQTASTLRAATARPHRPCSGAGSLLRPRLQGAFCSLLNPVCQLQTFARAVPRLETQFAPPDWADAGAM